MSCFLIVVISYVVVEPTLVSITIYLGNITYLYVLIYRVLFMSNE